MMSMCRAMFLFVSVAIFHPAYGCTPKEVKTYSICKQRQTGEIECKTKCVSSAIQLSTKTYTSLTDCQTDAATFSPCFNGTSGSHVSCLPLSERAEGVYRVYTSQLLDAINNIRATVQPTPSPALVPYQWSDELAQLATRWAGQCKYDYELDTTRTSVPSRGWTITTASRFFSTSESHGYDISDAVDAWTNPSRYWTYGKGSNATVNAETDLWTALIWNSTTHVGCGMAKCSSIEGRPYARFSIFCYFGPAANFNQQYPAFPYSIEGGFPSAPNQSVTPSHPDPTEGSVCGHSEYLNFADNPGSGIVGGVTALPGQYPWLVRVLVKNATGGLLRKCQGSIIDEEWILTAASCFITGYNIAQTTIEYAQHNITDTSEEGESSSQAVDVVIHPLFRSANSDYDAALIYVPPINLTESWKKQAICLPSNDCSQDGCEVGTTAYITGWGFTKASLTTGFSDEASVLQTAYVQIAEREYCVGNQAVLSSPITDRHICAGQPAGGVSTCGDRGAPLMVINSGKYSSCGISNYASGCGAIPAVSSIFTRTCVIRDWIDNEISA